MAQRTTTPSDETEAIDSVIEELSTPPEPNVPAQSASTLGNSFSDLLPDESTDIVGSNQSEVHGKPSEPSDTSTDKNGATSASSSPDESSMAMIDDIYDEIVSDSTDSSVAPSTGSFNSEQRTYAPHECIPAEPAPGLSETQIPSVASLSKSLFGVFTPSVPTTSIIRFGIYAVRVSLGGLRDVLIVVFGVFLGLLYALLRVTSPIVAVGGLTIFALGVFATGSLWFSQWVPIGSSLFYEKIGVSVLTLVGSSLVGLAGLSYHRTVIPAIDERLTEESVTTVQEPY